MSNMALPMDHLERVFGRDMHGNGWEVDVPAPANDDDMIGSLDPGFLLTLLKRGRK